MSTPMRTLLFAVFISTTAAQAYSPVRLPLAALSATPGSTKDDEEDDESPAAKAAASQKGPTGTAPELAPKQGPKAEAPASPSGTLAAPGPGPSNPDVQKLVSGAPLYNPNVAVHIVEKKQFSDRSKREIVLYPAALQANGKFTQHIGSALSAIYHLHENFALQVSGQYNWLASESAFNGELIDKVRQEAQAASSLLLVWGALGGVEVTPLYGKFAWYENSLAHFSLVLNGGVGVGATRHQLKPAKLTPATFGETGMKFMGSVGGGFRVQLGDRFAVRLEVRDLVYTARVDNVNGCNLGDLDAMNSALNNGKNLSGVPVTSSCKIEKFDNEGKTDVPLAKSLVATPSSDVLNNVGVYAGFAFLF